MADFYKRYKNLFSFRDSPPSNNFSINRQLFTQPPAPFYSLPQQDRKTSNYLDVGRSPALDQFQKKVLPKFGKPFPRQQLSRIKTQMDSNTLKMNEKLNQNFNQQKQFYKLPPIYTKQIPVPIRQRIMTEDSQLLKPDLYRKKQSKNMNKRIQQLQKQYLKHEYTNLQDRVTDNQQKQVSQIHKSRFKANQAYDQNQFKGSRLQRVNYLNPIKRWELKVLPDFQRKRKEFNQKTPRQIGKISPEFQLYQSRQKQLYGMRQNQYAFVNTKLEDIKKAEKYYPRGYINSYREALFRRKHAKKIIQDRRIKLKLMLYEQDSKF